MADLDPARLADRLAGRSDVAGAYVFGSRARGTGRPDSDVDVAVLLAEEGRRETRLELLALLRPAVAPRRLDLLILNGAPPSLAYRVLKEGTLIYEADHSVVATHREETVRRYLDLEPLRRELAQGVRDRVLEGRFGR